ALDGNPGVWHIEQTSSGVFGSWTPDWRIQLRKIIASSTTDGRIDVFGIENLNGVAWHSWENTPNGSIGPWTPIYIPPFVEVVPYFGGPTPELFALGNDTRVWRSMLSGGQWLPWTLVGTDIVGVTALAVAPNVDHRAELFAAQPGAGF